MRRALVAAVVAVCVLSCAGQCWDRKDLFGSNSVAGGHMVFSPPNYSEEVWDRMAQAGVTSSRMAASWREIEAVPGIYDFSLIDADVYHAVEHGIEPYVLVVNTPGWAREDGIPSHFGPPTEESAPYFIAFCTALAQRYGSLATHYEIWNEQNGCGWEFPPFNQVDEYLPWLRRAYQGLKAGNPDCMVSIGGLDDAEGHSPYFMNPLYELLDGPDDRPFDAVATHPYGPAAELRWKLRQLRDIMVANGDSDKPVWLTEWGFYCKPNAEQQQASDTYDYLQVLMEPEFAYVTEANLLCIGDFQGEIGGFGLTDFNLRPKPSFYTFQSFPRPGEPTIHHVSIRSTKAGQAEVTWQTVLGSDSQVEYGPTENYGFTTTLDPTTTTNHSATLTGLTPGQEHHLRVKSGGYVSGDYRFLAAGPDLFNGDFESDFPAGMARGWIVEGQGNAADSSQDTGVVRGGSRAQEFYVEGSWGYKINDVMYQQVALGKNAAYTFSAWTRGDTQDIKRKVGTDPTGGTDPNAGTVVWSSELWSNNVWQKQEVSSLSTADVVTVFVKVDSTTTNAIPYKIYVDDAEVATYTLADDPKSLPDGTPVQVSGVVGAGSDQFSMVAYIQHPDRIYGIRLNSVINQHSPGDILMVTGTMATVYGERCIMCSSTAEVGSVDPPEPLALTNQGVVGEDQLDCRGIVVRTFGTVQSVNTPGKFFVIDDGSVDGGMYVLYSGLASGNSITPPSVGQKVVMTGISSSGGADSALRRLLRPRNQSDIQVVP